MRIKSWVRGVLTVMILAGALTVCGGVALALKIPITTLKYYGGSGGKYESCNKAEGRARGSGMKNGWSSEWYTLYCETLPGLSWRYYLIDKVKKGIENDSSGLEQKWVKLDKGHIYIRPQCDHETGECALGGNIKCTENDGVGYFRHGFEQYVVNKAGDRNAVNRQVRLLPKSAPGLNPQYLGNFIKGLGGSEIEVFDPFPGVVNVEDEAMQKALRELNQKAENAGIRGVLVSNSFTKQAYEWAREHDQTKKPMLEFDRNNTMTHFCFDYKNPDENKKEATSTLDSASVATGSLMNGGLVTVTSTSPNVGEKVGQIRVPYGEKVSVTFSHYIKQGLAGDDKYKKYNMDRDTNWRIRYEKSDMLHIKEFVNKLDNDPVASGTLDLSKSYEKPEWVMYGSPALLRYENTNDTKHRQASMICQSIEYNKKTRKFLVEQEGANEKVAVSYMDPSIGKSAVCMAIIFEPKGAKTPPPPTGGPGTPPGTPGGGPGTVPVSPAPVCPIPGVSIPNSSKSGGESKSYSGVAKLTKLSRNGKTKILDDYDRLDWKMDNNVLWARPSDTVQFVHCYYPGAQAARDNTYKTCPYKPTPTHDHIFSLPRFSTAVPLPFLDDRVSLATPV